MPNFLRTVSTCFAVAVVLSGGALGAQQGKPLDKGARADIAMMLRDAHDEVKKNYYDPKLHGVDWDARYKQFGDAIPNAQSMGQGFQIVSNFLNGLKDSHTYFMPPDRSNRFDPGYRLRVIGDGVYVTELRPESDAAGKLHVGDQVLTLDGYRVTRPIFHSLSYFVNVLAPQPVIQLGLLAPDGSTRVVQVTPALKRGKKMLDLSQGQDIYDIIRQMENEDHVTRSRVEEKGDVAIWKIPEFDLDAYAVDKGIGIARKHKALILDLRDNGGGAEDTLEDLVGGLFDRDVKIADRQGRKETKPMIAKHHSTTFDGKLIVLVNSHSASASELLARVAQLEKRGVVIGDVSAGAVMEAKHYGEEHGADTELLYAFSITEANLIMSDGQSLENVGVKPDELMLPTAADLAAGRDPVLAHAVEEAGGKLDPVEAAKLFPFEWLPL